MLKIEKAQFYPSLLMCTKNFTVSLFKGLVKSNLLFSHTYTRLKVVSRDSEILFWSPFQVV